MIDDLIKRVLELDSKATAGPWITTGGGVAPGADENVATIHQWSEHADAADAILIAEYRSAAPALARELEKVRAERDAWREKYVDLEIHRASCCAEMEDKLARVEALANRWRYNDGVPINRLLEILKP